MTTTYTVINRSSGNPEARHLTAWEAAQVVLTHDGHDYEVRRGDGRWELLVSRGSRNSFSGLRGLVPAWSHHRLIVSREVAEADALADIGRQVCLAGWEGVPDIMTDADYDAMLAASATENEGDQ